MKIGIPFIISAPSGAGKTTIIKEIQKIHSHMKLSISLTTRQPRSSEENHRDYHFVTEHEFLEMKNNDDLLEFARVFENWYGTPKKRSIELLNLGHDVIFDIDWQGAQKIRKLLSNDDPISIFILPPSLEELQKRLKNRSEDDSRVIAKRIEKAYGEIVHWDEYDYVLVNDELSQAVQKVSNIIHAEHLKRKRQPTLKDLVQRFESIV